MDRREHTGRREPHPRARVLPGARPARTPPRRRPLHPRALDRSHRDGEAVVASSLSLLAWCANTFEVPCVPGDLSFTDAHLPGLSRGVRLVGPRRCGAVRPRRGSRRASVRRPAVRGHRDPRLSGQRGSFVSRTFPCPSSTATAMRSRWRPPTRERGAPFPVGTPSVLRARDPAAARFPLAEPTPSISQTSGRSRSVRSHEQGCDRRGRPRVQRGGLSRPRRSTDQRAGGVANGSVSASPGPVASPGRLGVGRQEDPVRCPAAVAFLHPRTPLRSAKRRTSVSPTPTPGGDGARQVPVGILRTPCPAGPRGRPDRRLRPRSGPRRGAPGPKPHGGRGRAWRAALASRFSTMRSTLALDRLSHRLQFDDEAIAGHEIGFLDDATDERAHVGLLELWGDDAAGEPIHVEQVRDEAFEPTGVGRDATGEVARVGFVELHVATLERDREAEDRGERCAEVVRDCLQGVFFISSSKRSRWLASRSTASARSSCAWVPSVPSRRAGTLAGRASCRVVPPGGPRPGPTRSARPSRSSGTPSRSGRPRWCCSRHLQRARGRDRPGG